MMSLRSILTISSYEGKVLWRNWFFRITALAGLFFLTIFNLAVFSELDDAEWRGLANGWILPYASLLLISVPQAAAVIFLATGLIKKDKKLDTNEVFFVRPITNLDYVIGKALALVKLFFLLNLTLLCIPLIVGLTSPVATVNPLAFCIYPFLTSLPTIVFTTGISFLLVTLIRNQPVSIVLLIGLAGVQLIYYFEQFGNILDFTSFRLPMLASEMTGFVDIEFALWQRAFFLVTGIAFLFLTAFLLDRLASQRTSHRATAFAGMILIALSAIIMNNLWSMRQNSIELREQMISINGRWANVPNGHITSHHISLAWLDSEISCTSELRMENSTGSVLDTIYFTLNPSLIVETVFVDNKQVPFQRDGHLLILTEGIQIENNENAAVQVKYHGRVTQSLAHLEVSQDRYENANEHLMFSLWKKYAFLEDDYLLLTSDVHWYPGTDIGYNKTAVERSSSSFIDFELTVEVPPGKIAISQGSAIIDSGSYTFKPEYPLPQISLVIGDYQKKEIMVDSITYSVFYHPKNNYFLTHLEQLGDTLTYLIADMANEYEDAQELPYPFKRLQFVEVPLHFTAYDKIYESHQAYIQPETVFWPEEGGELGQFDLRRQVKEMRKQAAKTNQVLTDKQVQANVFKNLFRTVFTKQAGTHWVYEGHDTDRADYALFPNYYDFSSGIASREWPLLNRSIAIYLRKDNQIQNDYSREIDGISFTEQCNELMRTSSMTGILTGSEFGKIRKSVALKSQYLLSYLGAIIGETTFKSFLYSWIKAHPHQMTRYEDFRHAVLMQFNIDIGPVIRQVFADTAQPAFEILDVQKFEVMDRDRKRFQVLVTARNSGNADGIMELKFNNKKESVDNNQEPPEEIARRISVLRQGETRQFGFIMDEKPHELMINTVISRNIPSVIGIPMGTWSAQEGRPLFDGERLLEPRQPTPYYEVIVDNEDPQFTHFSPIKPTILKAYLDGKKAKDRKYFGRWSSSYSTWLATTGSDLYGTVIRSAHFTRSGTGEKIATWTPEFKDEGYYDMYVYMRGKNQNEYIGPNNEGRQFNYHYIVRSSDGTENITYSVSDAEPGWNYLGSYYFTKTGGSLSLTDQCDLRTVYADAVKWVKQ